VTWPCELDLWLFDLGFISRDANWVVNLWIRFTVPVLRRVQFSVDRQVKVPTPNIYVFEVQRGQILNFIFLTQKGTTLARTMYNDGGVCPKCGRGEDSKKGRKLSCVKLATCPDHRRRFSPRKFRMLCFVRETVISWKSVEGSRRC